MLRQQQLRQQQQQQQQLQQQVKVPYPTAAAITTVTNPAAVHYPSYYVTPGAQATEAYLIYIEPLCTLIFNNRVRYTAYYGYPYYGYPTTASTTGLQPTAAYTVSLTKRL